MKEYIERAAAMESIIGLTIVDPAVAQYANAVYYNLQSLPAADVVEVRHGRWKNGGNGLYDTCTACGEEIYLAIPMNYCPLCGARMEKEAEHEAD